MAVRPHTRRPFARTSIAALTAASLVGLAGCGGDEAATEGADQAATTTTTTEADRLVAAHARLDGRYAHYDVVAYEGDGMKTLIISYGFTDLNDEGGELVAQESFCFSEHRSDQPITTEVSDAFTQAIKPVPIATTVTLDDDGRASIQRDETPTALGIELADPANETLPQDPNDPRIIDADGDGNPGVTVRITVSPEVRGELYLARRERFAYEVTEQADATLVGTVRDRSEQLVIGASDPVFLNDAQWVQHPDPAKSPIILIPVERSWDCERLRAERPALFPPTPEVDW